MDQTGNPVEWFPYVSKEANQLVEEFMLLANMRVADKIVRAFPDIALLRNHSEPMERKVEKFQTFCKTISCPLSSENAREMAISLTKLQNDETWGTKFEALQILVTRTLQLAKYFCSGDLEPKLWRHFALNVATYTHFTSPIRRYPDLIVHRLLNAALIGETYGLHSKAYLHAYESLPTKNEMSEIGELANDKKYSAKKAGEQSRDLFLSLLLKNSPTISNATVLSLGEKFITAIVSCYAMEIKISLDDLVLNAFFYDEKQDKLILKWPTVPGSKNEKEDGIEQSLHSMSLIRVKMASKLVKNRLTLNSELLHPNLTQINQESELDASCNLEYEELD